METLGFYKMEFANTARVILFISVSRIELITKEISWQSHNISKPQATVGEPH